MSASHAREGNNRNIFVNVENCKYKLIRDVLRRDLKWRISSTEETQDTWDVMWLDSGLGISCRVKQMRRYQRINHFPGMVQIYRKGHLARAMNKMRKISNEFDFVPRTWVLPGDAKHIKQYYDDFPGSCLIIKPSNGAQGRGIYLALSFDEIAPTQDAVAQSYIRNPLLINGYKFDLRIYALVISCDPLRILIYKEGLVRLCTTKYCKPNKENATCQFMHLTNYSVNKTNTDYVENNNSENEDNSSKRSLSWLWKWLDESGVSSTEVWSRISDLVVKTLISVQASLAYSYHSAKLEELDHTPLSCFEVLGFDVILTDTLTPMLIEVNHTPSFRTDSLLDARVKSGLIRDTLTVLNVTADERQTYQKERAAAAQIRLYGSKFTSSPSKVSSHCIRYTSPQSLWMSYLENEAKVLPQRAFQLVYPTNEYPDLISPTRGKQGLYDELLRIAGELFWRGVGVGPVKSSDVDVTANPSKSMQPVPPTTRRSSAAITRSVQRTTPVKRSKSAEEQRRRSVQLSDGFPIYSRASASEQCISNVASEDVQEWSTVEAMTTQIVVVVEEQEKSGISFIDSMQACSSTEAEQGIPMELGVVHSSNNEMVSSSDKKETDSHSFVLSALKESRQYRAYFEQFRRSVRNYQKKDTSIEKEEKDVSAFVPM